MTKRFPEKREFKIFAGGNILIWRHLVKMGIYEIIGSADSPVVERRKVWQIAISTRCVRSTDGVSNTVVHDSETRLQVNYKSLCKYWCLPGSRNWDKLCGKCTNHSEKYEDTETTLKVYFTHVSTHGFEWRPTLVFVEYLYQIVYRYISLDWFFNRL